MSELIPCAHRGCRLTYKQHETALLVEVQAARIANEDGTGTPELHAYLLACKPLCEEDHYAGFAFMRAK